MMKISRAKNLLKRLKKLKSKILLKIKSPSLLRTGFFVYFFDPDKRP